MADSVFIVERVRKGGERGEESEERPEGDESEERRRIEKVGRRQVSEAGSKGEEGKRKRTWCGWERGMSSAVSWVWRVLRSVLFGWWEKERTPSNRQTRGRRKKEEGQRNETAKQKGRKQRMAVGSLQIALRPRTRDGPLKKNESLPLPLPLALISLSLVGDPLPLPL